MLKRTKIDLNNARLQELGLKRMEDSLFGSNKKAKTKNSKQTTNKRVLDDGDRDYQQPEDEDYCSYYSDEKELIDKIMARKRMEESRVTEMQHASTPITEIQGSLATDSTVAPTLTPTQERSVEQDATPSPLAQQIVRASTSRRVRGATQTEMPHIESNVAHSPTQGSMPAPTSMASIPGSLTNTIVRASTSRSVRGPTRGINTEHLIASHGGAKNVVEIPLEVGVPVGEHATRFASWVGVQVRMGAPLKEFEKWSEIPSAIEAPIIQAIRDKFDVEKYDEEEHVMSAVNRKCQTLYKNWRHKMKRRYQESVKAGQNAYSKPYRGVSPEDWAWMIDNIWTNADKEERAKKERKARASVPFNHAMGSQSFAAAMSSQTQKDGQRPHIADFYKTSHYNKKKKKWVGSICEQVHVQLEAWRQEFEPTESTVTMPEEKMALEVDGKKFYVKKYSISQKPLPSKWSSGPLGEEVRVLKNQVETLTDVCERQVNQVETLKELCQRQEESISAYAEKYEIIPN